ncbi:site-specific integrase [Ligilactobacillus murinus]|uniref:site-specific integrase n=1 Tax=Ligilactobacillus murinus TaxID=1622 RepID=UPI00351884EC
MASISKYKTKKGEFYRVQVYAGKNANGKNKIVTRRGFKTLREAKKVADKISVEVNSGEFINETNITFQQVYDQWLETYKLTVKESTLVRTLSAFRTRILPVLGHVPISKITPSMCQDLVNSWAKDRLVLCKSMFFRTSRIFRYAKNLSLIKANPMDNVTIPRVASKSEGKKTYYTKDELELFLSFAQKYPNKIVYPLLRLLSFTGMRKGEALALQWKDIDFDVGTIKIEKTLAQNIDRQPVVNTPKTKTSRRTIYLDNKTLQVLHKWHNEQRIILLQHGFNSSSSKQLVFSNYKTNSFLNGTMPNFWAKRVQKKAGLECIPVHGLRHTYATLAIQAGMNPKELQIQLGHKDVQVTLGIYASLTQQQKVETPDKFTAFVNF